ncbi:MAG: MBL fold metallo-hydrolase [Planctomycetes bacterium]|nr:MBL fold metallo-hydrolase [Planctomycetota bacterium]
MIVHQFYLGCLSHASYIIADEVNGQALIVDPRRDIDIYVSYLQEHKLSLKGVALTHFHADFLAGHIEIRNRYQVPIYMGQHAESEFSIEALAHHQKITIGDVVVEALLTPGHTPEGISLVVRETQDARPYAVLTGDTLFIGDVGRPDLLASVGVTSEELASQLYESLHQQLLSLDDDVLVYPAHGAGSLCGKNLSKDTVSTIGEQRNNNYALQEKDKDKFIDMVTQEQPKAPPYFLHDAILNKKERPELGSYKAFLKAPLDIKTIINHIELNHDVVDTREADDFHTKHLKGTLNIGVQGRYAPWAGSLLDPQRPIVVIAMEAELEESALRLARIGYDHVVGLASWESLEGQIEPDQMGSTQRIAGSELPQLFQQEQPVILDVRAKGETESGKFPQAVNIPLDELPESIAQLNPQSPTLVHCAGGYRSSAAVSFLQANGFTEVKDLEGGFKQEYV